MEGMITEGHGTLLVVGDVEESYMYLSRQVIEKLQVIYSGDVCWGDLSQLLYRTYTLKQTCRSYRTDY